jgi:mannitol/fructose-specific phosphotransferase system IIA component (Ntr-type)
MSAAPLVDAARVRLGLTAATRAEAVEATARLLEGDARVGPWGDLWESIGTRQIVEPGTGGVCLAHGRRGTVKQLALAAARLDQPVAGENGPVRLFFVFAIPSAMAEEYLRAVGALARVCGDEAKRAALEAAASPEELAGLLGEWIG